MTDAPILYSFRRCPFAMRARMAIAVSKTPVRLREIILRDKPDTMIEASPKGTVPVLVTEDGVIDESLEVMDWALAQNDPENWLAGKDDALIAECDGDFKHHLDRYKYSTRYEGADRDEHREAGMAFLRKLDERLSGKKFLCGDAPTYADIAIFPFVRQFRIADPDWLDAAKIPNIQKWLSTLMDCELFKSIMKKYPLWKEAGEEFEFPERDARWGVSRGFNRGAHQE
ncbi:MAG: glutathione S-transferase [Marinicaulis sp.]|nr:glutathione S-transferase [Marinicaulis sp.]NNE40056.1 glutathione S-transferase [Marinicaulis sp.]NNL88476.1 glutathione S-transferase [Marinicaulis sp.]